jgi:hypothetical protein
VTRVDGCFNYIPGLTNPGPNNPAPAMCQQIIQTAFNSWCGAGENFHAEKCEHVTGAMEAYELATIRYLIEKEKRRS